MTREKLKENKKNKEKNDKNKLYFKKGERYDYSLKSKNERADYIDEKLSFIFELTPDVIMGYSGSNRTAHNKDDKVPKMIEAYTTYFLESKGVGNKRNIEYPYYINRRDEVRNKGWKMTNDVGMSSDNDSKTVEYENWKFEYPKNICEQVEVNMAIEEDKKWSSTYIDSEVLLYAIKNNELDKNSYKVILSHSIDILKETDNDELKKEIEQILFNCVMGSRDENDMNILKKYVEGATIRDIAKSVEVSHTTVMRRVNAMLNWA